MNRSSNLLNGSLLGTAGRSSKIFLQATQWSSAQVTALLVAGRKLTSSTDLTQVVTNTTLRAGRHLKASLVGSISAIPNVVNMSAVSLSASLVSTVSITATIRKMKSVLLSAAQTLIHQSTVVLRKMSHVSMAINQENKAEIVVNMRRAHQVTLATVLTGSVVTPLVPLYKGSKLRSASVLSLQLNRSVLSESSRVRAPIKRTSYVLINNRTSVIPGN